MDFSDEEVPVEDDDGMEDWEREFWESNPVVGGLDGYGSIG